MFGRDQQQAARQQQKTWDCKKVFGLATNLESTLTGKKTWKVSGLTKTFNWKVFEPGKTLASIWTSKKSLECILTMKNLESIWTRKK